MERSRKITTMALIITMLISSTVIMDNSWGEDVGAEPTRASGETLRINGTVTIDKTTPQTERTYESIIIEDEGSLVINGGVLITKTIICKPDTKNTSFIMKNDGNVRSTLTVQGGFFDVRAGEISLTRSTISVSNETGTLSNGENGHDSSVTLMSSSSNLVINDSTINVQGQVGAGGGSGSSGGRGGSASLTISTTGSNALDISGSTLEIFGAKGGDAFSAGWISGKGGDAYINIQAHSVEVRDSMIFEESGDAGVAGSSSIGSAAGNSQMRFESYNSDIVIRSSQITSEAGVSSEGIEVNSFIKMNAKLGSILWDQGKEGEDRFRSLSSLDADIIQMETRDGSRLYQVDVGSNPPSGFGGSSVEIYWWAHVKVLDNTGSPMDNVAIRYFEPPFTEILYPRDGAVFTDSEGNAWIEVVGYRDERYVRYTFTAEDPGGAVGSSDQIRLRENRNELIYINLTTITIVTPFSDGQLIGGEVRFEGSAESGGLNNVVNRVVIYIDDEVLGEAEDTSPDGAPPFSNWLFVWDSRAVPDDVYDFSFVGFDNSYQATEVISLRVDQKSVPHPPLLDIVEVTDTRGTAEVPPGGSTEVHVSQKDQFINFDVFIFDIDYRSETLTVGKAIVSAEYRLIYNKTGETIITRMVNEFSKKNESGGFSFDFQIDASKKPGTSSALDNGLYRIEFDIKDDAGYQKERQQIHFELFFDYYPNAYAFIDMIDGYRLEKDIVPREDQFEDYEAFRLTTDQSHTIKVRFNVTRSTDQDSDKFGAGQSYQDLVFSMRVRRKTDTGSPTVVVNDAKGVPFVEYEFNVEDIKGDGTGDFDVWIDAIDEDGLEDTVRYIIRISHDPPKEEHSIMGDLTGANSFDILDQGLMGILYPILFIIFLVASLGSMFFFMFKYNNDKKKKMDLIERKRKQDREREKDTSIDEEISGKYMSTSQKYLEKTGGGKDKEDFAKQLQEYSVGGSQQTSEESGEGSQQQQPPVPAQQEPSAPVPAQQQPPVPAQQQPPQVPNPPAAPPIPKPPGQ